MRQEKDISRNTLLVLIFLAIMVSVLGTWVTLQTLEPRVVQTTTSHGTVQFQVVEPNHSQDTSQATGNVILNIKEGGN